MALKFLNHFNFQVITNISKNCCIQNLFGVGYLANDAIFHLFSPMLTLNSFKWNFDVLLMVMRFQETVWNLCYHPLLNTTHEQESCVVFSRFQREPTPEQAMCLSVRNVTSLDGETQVGFVILQYYATLCYAILYHTKLYFSKITILNIAQEPPGIIKSPNLFTIPYVVRDELFSDGNTSNNPNEHNWNSLFIMSLSYCSILHCSCGWWSAPRRSSRGPDPSSGIGRLSGEILLHPIPGLRWIHLRLQTEWQWWPHWILLRKFIFWT